MAYQNDAIREKGVCGYMEKLMVEGLRRLSGAVPIHGAKNSALPVLAATLLADGESRIDNCPDLADVRASVEILRWLGCRVAYDRHSMTVDTAGLCRQDVPDHLMREMRSSIVFLGAMVARMGGADLSFPGGCELGSPLRRRAVTCIARRRKGCAGRRSPCRSPVWERPRTSCWRR